MDIKVLVPVAQGTEDMEAVIIIDLLRRAGINVKVAGENEIITCARGIKIIPDILIRKLASDDYFDAIIIPGGSEGTHNLLENDKFISILKNQHEKGRLIGAICAAPSILSFHKILTTETNVTSHPSVKSQLINCQYVDEDVVVSGNIITSKAAGTATDFALKIIEILADLDTAHQIADEIYYSFN